jgi:hypothetical protein
LVVGFFQQALNPSTEARLLEFRLSASFQELSRSVDLAILVRDAQRSLPGSAGLE